MKDRCLRLLLIEDSDDDAELVTRALERGGYDVERSVVGGEAALRDALLSGEHDLAITDHELQGFDSEGVLAVIEELAPDLPCVLVSGKVGEEAVGRAMRLGASDYVAKDNLGRLPPAVERILVEREQRLERNASAEALARSGQLFEAVFDNARDAMLIVDGERRLVNINPAACELVEMARDDLLTLRIDDLMPEEWRVNPTRVWAEFLSAGHRRGETEIVSAGGTLVATEYTAAANFLPGLHIMVMRDIRERRAADADRERRSAQQKAIAQLGEYALREKDLDSLAEAVVERVAETLQVEMASLHEMDQGGGFVVRSQVGMGAISAGRRTPPGPPESSPIAFAADQDQPVLVDDFENEKRFQPSAILAERGIRSALVVAIPGKPRAFGVFGVASTKASAFSEDDASFLTSVAHLLSDAWKRSRTEEAARNRALHDELTGLPNRSLFFDRLTLGLARSKRTQTRLAVILLDIDHFKVLNDILGHRAADRVLVQVAARISKATRETDTVARLGGDEFTVLCEDLAGEDELKTLTARLFSALEVPLDIEGESYELSASVGVALSGPDVVGADDILRDADIALHRSKELGRDTWTVATEEMRLAVIARAETEQALRRAIDEDELLLHYQPIVDLDGGGMCGVEALVRWEDPKRGMVPPGEFIPLAEESRLILSIGEWVLRSACRQAAQWRAEYGDSAPLPIHVNFSARQIAQTGLPEFVLGVLEEFGVPPDDIAVEITETALVDGVGTPATLRELKQTGLRVVLDDFGTGYSSLSYLERFPIDELKIDRTFISRLGEADAPIAVVAAIIGIARALSLGTVAEGVETAEEAGAVAALGGTRAQGYFFARPAPAEQIAQLVQDDTPLRERAAEGTASGLEQAREQAGALAAAS